MDIWTEILLIIMICVIYDFCKFMLCDIFHTQTQHGYQPKAGETEPSPPTGGSEVEVKKTPPVTPNPYRPEKKKGISGGYNRDTGRSLFSGSNLSKQNPQDHKFEAVGLPGETECFHCQYPQEDHEC